MQIQMLRTSLSQISELFSAKLSRAVALGSFILSGGLVATAGPISLVLPQSTTFSFLGRSCGGIQEHAYATGFDSVTGYPFGDVYIQTRCGGSGRGGGYKTTTYSAWVAVMWDFGGNVLAATKLTVAPVINPTLNTFDPYGDQLYNTSAAAFLVVPPPGAPGIVSAVQSGDMAQVSWTTTVANPEAITSSTLTATPVNSVASIVTATINGSGDSGLVGPLQPQTTYEITVVNSTIGGTGPLSQSVTLTTQAASTPPAAPTGIKARWGSEGATTAQLLVTWNAAVPGDSPIDAYEATITGSDGGGTFTEDVSGSTLNATFTVDFIPDWSVRVRAHNAAGWGPWSARVTLGGL